MSVTVTVMPDVTSGSDINKLGLSGFRFVGGYVSGKPGTGIEWTNAQWEAITPAVGVRIYQGYGPMPALRSFDEVDVERGALTPVEAAQILRARVDAGIQWTYFYGSRDTLDAVHQEGAKLGDKYWIGHAQCRLADWNLSRAEAEGVVGGSVAGMTCYAVQWASPTSNPNTIMPGSGMTLREANVDLSVIDVRWRQTPPAAPVPVPVPVKPTVVKVIAAFSDGSTQDWL